MRIQINAAGKISLLQRSQLSSRIQLCGVNLSLPMWADQIILRVPSKAIRYNSPEISNDVTSERKARNRSRPQSFCSVFLKGVSEVLYTGIIPTECDTRRGVCAVFAAHTALLHVRFQPYLKVSIVASSEDSDLEAFSHNPADGSFAPVAGQPSANTKCLNQLFLSY
ncbi:hypothetical protein LOD99_10606 [Oopsacas minuta]|uniref:Uncharacterized protein n=1 Tax=Oopsacas minuta TaxID=111878 RepID=A0AAV7KEQ8_9METZ|nr:hypothetical protein LOD99_10606 [Oopsacas minuta]